ncbi:MAG: hypothetical protein M1821_008741 [Bathelium mastoideum]|nr:MAG: hypothetical protein M1821_008741 [Bathelium mastoideum]KAI9685901.1 MAG: hypothetical protein M1822_004179 [Bathelium mastoideum]
MAEAEEPFVPPLPDEAPPDDGWEAHWDANAQAYYFFNRFSGVTTWDNPRVPDKPAQESAPGTDPSTHDTTHPTEPPPSGAESSSSSEPEKSSYTGYNPKIHGDFDPTADYARAYTSDDPSNSNSNNTTNTSEALVALASDYPSSATEAEGADYASSAHFNRFTGRFQDTSSANPERHGDAAKAQRQLRAFYDADAQANRHDGRSLKAERQGRKLTKEEVRGYNEKRKRKKEEKRRAFYRD